MAATDVLGRFSAPTAECAITLHVEESGMLLGAARFQGEVRLPVFVPIFRLTGLSIEDPDAGDLNIGVQLASEADGRTPDGDVP